MFLSQVIFCLFLPPLLFWLVSFRDDAWDDIGSQCDRHRDGSKEVSGRFIVITTSVITYDIIFHIYIFTYTLHQLLEDVSYIERRPQKMWKKYILFQTKSDAPGYSIMITRQCEIACTRSLRRTFYGITHCFHYEPV